MHARRAMRDATSLHVAEKAVDARWIRNRIGLIKTRWRQSTVVQLLRESGVWICTLKVDAHSLTSVVCNSDGCGM